MDRCKPAFLLDTETFQDPLAEPEIEVDDGPEGALAAEFEQIAAALDNPEDVPLDADGHFILDNIPNPNDNPDPATIEAEGDEDPEIAFNFDTPIDLDEEIFAPRRSKRLSPKDTDCDIQIEQNNELDQDNDTHACVLVDRQPNLHYPLPNCKVVLDRIDQ